MLGCRCVIISPMRQLLLQETQGERRVHVCAMRWCVWKALWEGAGAWKGTWWWWGGVEEEGEGPLHYIPSCMF